MPFSSSSGMTRARFWGLHWGNSCQSRNLVTPGHNVSFGVPRSLQGQGTGAGWNEDESSTFCCTALQQTNGSSGSQEGREFSERRYVGASC